MSSCSRMLLIAVVASSMASITGCGGSSNAASTTQGPTQPTYSASAKYAYVATGSGFVDEYSISTSGTFTKIGSAPTTNGPTGTSIAIDPKYRFLYAISGADGGSTISMFTINASTGVLVPTSPASVNIAGTFSQGIAVDGLGKFVYTADTDSQTVSSLSINQTTGVLTPTSVPSVPGSYATNGVTADASGKYVYASNENGLISEFVINQTTGNLTPNSPATVAGAPFPFFGTINAAETYYYSPGKLGNYVVVLAMNSSTGILSEVGSNQITTGNGPTSVALTPNGQFAYVTNLTDQSISMFSVNATTGLLTSLGPAAAPQGQDPINVVVDPSGQLAYVSCLGAYAVTVFGINSNGTLTFQESVTTDEEPEAVVLVPR